MDEKNGWLHDGIKRFENSPRAIKHGQWGAHIFTNELAEMFGATKGDPFTGEDGRQYNTAYYADSEIGDQASKFIADKIWEKSEGDTLKFVSRYAGKPIDDPSVINYASVLNKNKSAQDYNGAVERFKNRETLLKKKDELIAENPDKESKIMSMIEAGRHSADGIRDEISKFIPKDAFDYESFKQDVKTSLDISNDEIEGAKNAFIRGYGNLKTMTNVLGLQLGINPEERVRQIASEQAKNESLPASDTFNRAMDVDNDFYTTLKEIGSDPISVTTQLATESLVQFLPPAIIVGLPIGIAATIVGAPAWITVATAGGIASLGMEWSSEILNSFSQQGVDVKDPDSLADAFSNEEVNSKAKQEALEKGVPVAIFDTISGGIAGRWVKMARNMGFTKNLTAVGKEILVQAGLGGTGEAVGQAVALDPEEGEQFNIPAMVAESIVEIGTGSVSGVVTLTFDNGNSIEVPEDDPLVQDLITAKTNQLQEPTTDKEVVYKNKVGELTNYKDKVSIGFSEGNIEDVFTEQRVLDSGYNPEQFSDLLIKEGEKGYVNDGVNRYRIPVRANNSEFGDGTRRVLLSKEASESDFLEDTAEAVYDRMDEVNPTLKRDIGRWVAGVEEQAQLNNEPLAYTGAELFSKSLLRSLGYEVSEALPSYTVLPESIVEAFKQELTLDDGTNLIDGLEGKDLENLDSSQAIEVTGETVDSIGDRIVKGEELSTPEDLQFYENNKKDIEASLKALKDETNGQMRLEGFALSTEEAYQRLKNNSPIIKAGESVNVKDIPKVIKRIETMAMKDIAKIFDSDEDVSSVLISPRRWYREGIDNTIKATAEFAPEIYNKESYFITSLGILSNGQPVDTNYNQSVNVYMNTENNKLPFVSYTSDQGVVYQAFGGLSETGKPYGGVRSQTVSEHGIKLQKIVDKYGIENLDKFLLGTFKARDLKAKYGAMGYLTTKEELDGNVYGAMVFGNKIGSYIVNMHGIHENAVLDSWMFRTLARYTGLGKDSKSSPPKNAVVAMNKALSNVAKRWTEITSVPWGVDQVQAVLWYNEKEQYIKEGVRPQEGTSYEEISESTARTLSPSSRSEDSARDGVQGTNDPTKSRDRKRSNDARVNSERSVTGKPQGESERSLGDARRLRSLTPSQAPDFFRAITQSKEQTKFGSSVFAYTLDEYKDMKLYMTDNGSMGFGIKADGDIVSAFHNKSIDSNPHALATLIPYAISKGGTKLDAFNTVLPKAYSKFGFTEVSRAAWSDDFAPHDWDKKLYKNFNNGKPDIVYMELDTKKEGFSLSSSEQAEYAPYFNKKLTRKEINNAAKAEKLTLGTQKRDLVRTLSSQLNRINPKITEKLRRFQKRNADILRDYIDKTAPFAKMLKRMQKSAGSTKTKAEWVALKLALFNGNIETVESILRTNRRIGHYRAWKSVHENLHKQAMAVGLDMGHIENHFPREVVNYDAFLNHVAGITSSGKQSKLQEALVDAQDKAGRVLTEEEIISIANVLMRQVKGLNGTTKTGWAKARKIDQLTLEHLKFYDEPHTTLMRYGSGMAHMIAVAQYLGGSPNRYSVRKLSAVDPDIGQGVGIYDHRVGEFVENEHNDVISFKRRSNPNVSKVLEVLRKREQKETGLPFMSLQDQVGGMVTQLQADIGFNRGQEQRVKQLLTDYFNENSMNSIFTGMRNIGYISTMGSVFSAVTQLGDLGVAVYRAGRGKFLGFLRPSTYTRVVAEMFKSVTRLNKYTLKRLGVDDTILQELSDNKTSLQNAMNWIFKLSQLKLMDRIGKETFVNTVMQRYTKGAKQIVKGKNNRLTRDLNARIKRKFNAKEGQQLVNELASGKITEMTELLAYSELLDVQPVGRSELPVGYLRYPNGRILYMLKTFMLKRFDVFVTETQLLKQQGKHGAAIMNLAMMGVVLAMAEAGADLIKDKMAGRKTPTPEYIWFNLLKLVGISRYHSYNFINSKPSQAILKMIIPPYDYLDDPWMDIKFLIKRMDKYKNTREPAKLALRDFKKRGARWIKHIPVVGKHLYWLDDESDLAKTLRDAAPLMSPSAGNIGMDKRLKRQRNK